mmetsp:Transcript_80253/g.227259  ORF Transcript_80253/g.227259 Transcript_80253/m.227259 type:complete len:307 (-) Transcript_80253:609-1529(-)
MWPPRSSLAMALRVGATALRHRPVRRLHREEEQRDDTPHAQGQGEEAQRCPRLQAARVRAGHLEGGHGEQTHGTRREAERHPPHVCREGLQGPEVRGLPGEAAAGRGGGAEGHHQRHRGCAAAGERDEGQGGVQEALHEEADDEAAPAADPVGEEDRRHDPREVAEVEALQHVVRQLVPARRHEVLEHPRPPRVDDHGGGREDAEEREAVGQQLPVHPHERGEALARPLGEQLLLAVLREAQPRAPVEGLLAAVARVHPLQDVQRILLPAAREQEARGLHRAQRQSRHRGEPAGAHEQQPLPGVAG